MRGSLTASALPAFRSDLFSVFISGTPPPSYPPKSARSPPTHPPLSFPRLSSKIVSVQQGETMAYAADCSVHFTQKSSLSVCFSACLHVCLSVCFSVCLHVCLSVCLPHSLPQSVCTYIPMLIKQNSNTDLSALVRWNKKTKQKKARTKNEHPNINAQTHDQYGTFCGIGKTRKPRKASVNVSVG